MTRPSKTRPSCSATCTVGCAALLPPPPCRRCCDASATICAFVRMVPSGSSITPLPLGAPCSPKPLICHTQFLRPTITAVRPGVFFLFLSISMALSAGSKRVTTRMLVPRAAALRYTDQLPYRMAVPMRQCNKAPGMVCSVAQETQIHAFECAHIEESLAAALESDIDNCWGCLCGSVCE